MDPNQDEPQSAPRPTAIYVLLIEEPGRWYRRKTYWPLLNGQPPKSLLDEEALWGQATGVTVTRYHFELTPVDALPSDPDNFHDWMALGVEKGWCAEGVCQTHDLVPMSEEEEAAFEDGGDPCIPVLRAYPDNDKEEGA